jgi:adenine phosphoribosyltransferase
MTDPLSPLRRLIRDIPNFPKPGILFRDITPLLADASGLALAVELMANPFRGKNIDLVVGAESRGFIFGTAVACCLSAGFVLVRKPGKLPLATVEATYALEYGEDRLQIHADAIEPGEKVVLVDDLLATGGTAAAAAQLVRTIGGDPIAALFLIELTALNGRARLPDLRVETVLAF